jgi:hypothetical protein
VRSLNPDDESVVEVRRRAHLPFVQAAVAIVRDPALSCNAKALYVLLATYADLDDRSCYPSKVTLAAALNVTTKTVQRAIQELVEHEVMTVQSRRRKDGSQSTNLYELLDLHLMFVPRKEPDDEGWLVERRLEAIKEKREDRAARVYAHRAKQELDPRPRRGRAQRDGGGAG